MSLRIFHMVNNLDPPLPLQIQAVLTQRKKDIVAINKKMTYENKILWQNSQVFL